MSIEELDTSGGNFFTRSMDRFSEMVSETSKIAASGDKEAVRKKLEELKEMSDEFKNIDSSKLSDKERKFCKYFTRALDRTFDMYSHILDVFESGDIEKSPDKAGLKLFFMTTKGVSLIARDLNAAKKYMEEEPEMMR